MPKRIIIIDDHPLIIEGVKLLSANSEDFEVVKSVGSWDKL
jgi:DNA-binding NarL/FixJ family response regulator